MGGHPRTALTPFVGTPQNHPQQQRQPWGPPTHGFDTVCRPPPQPPQHPTKGFDTLGRPSRPPPSPFTEPPAAPSAITAQAPPGGPSKMPAQGLRPGQHPSPQDTCGLQTAPKLCRAAIPRRFPVSCSWRWMDGQRWKRHDSGWKLGSRIARRGDEMARAGKYRWHPGTGTHLPKGSDRCPGHMAAMMCHGQCRLLGPYDRLNEANSVDATGTAARTTLDGRTDAPVAWSAMWILRYWSSSTGTRPCIH